MQYGMEYNLLLIMYSNVDYDFQLFLYHYTVIMIRSLIKTSALLSCEKKVNAFSRFLKTCRFFSATERFFCVFVNSIIYLFR